MDIGSPEWSRLIAEGVAELGVAADADRLGIFARHAELLVEWNAVSNLTTITRPEDIAVQHFVDSLSAAGAVPAGAEVLDIGTGGGFPGIPLHVTVPGVRTVLLDAARKKVSFLRHVIRTIRLERVEALHARVEALHEDSEQRGRYDVIVSRAFASMPDLLHAAVPLIKPGGRIVALKGLLTDEELAQLRAECSVGAFGAVLQVTWSEYGLPGLRSRRMRVVALREGEKA